MSSDKDIKKIPAIKKEICCLKDKVENLEKSSLSSVNVTSVDIPKVIKDIKDFKLYFYRSGNVDFLVFTKVYTDGTQKRLLTRSIKLDHNNLPDDLPDDIKLAITDLSVGTDPIPVTTDLIKEIVGLKKDDDSGKVYLEYKNHDDTSSQVELDFPTHLEYIKEIIGLKQKNGKYILEYKNQNDVVLSVELNFLTGLFNSLSRVKSIVSLTKTTDNKIKLLYVDQADGAVEVELDSPISESEVKSIQGFAYNTTNKEFEFTYTKQDGTVIKTGIKSDRIKVIDSIAETAGRLAISYKDQDDQNKTVATNLSFVRSIESFTQSLNSNNDVVLDLKYKDQSNTSVSLPPLILNQGFLKPKILVVSPIIVELGKNTRIYITGRNFTNITNFVIEPLDGIEILDKHIITSEWAYIDIKSSNKGIKNIIVYNGSLRGDDVTYGTANNIIKISDSIEKIVPGDTHNWNISQKDKLLYRLEKGLLAPTNVDPIKNDGTYFGPILAAKDFEFSFNCYFYDPLESFGIIKFIDEVKDSSNILFSLNFNKTMIIGYSDSKFFNNMNNRNLNSNCNITLVRLHSENRLYIYYQDDFYNFSRGYRLYNPYNYLISTENYVLDLPNSFYIKMFFYSNIVLNDMYFKYIK